MTVDNPHHWNIVPEISFLLKKVIKSPLLLLAMFLKLWKLFSLKKIGSEIEK